MPYLENMRNNHQAPIRDSNGIIKDDLSGEWKNSVNNANQFCFFFTPLAKII